MMSHACILWMYKQGIVLHYKKNKKDKWKKWKPDKGFNYIFKVNKNAKNRSESSNS